MPAAPGVCHMKTVSSTFGRQNNINYTNFSFALLLHFSFHFHFIRNKSQIEKNAESKINKKPRLWAGSNPNYVFQFALLPFAGILSSAATCSYDMLCN